MTIIGSGAVIVGFWSLAAVGLFLAFAAFNGLRGRSGGVPFIPSITGVRGWHRGTAVAVEAILLLVGAFQVGLGVYGVFSTVY